MAAQKGVKTRAASIVYQLPSFTQSNAMDMASGLGAQRASLRRHARTIHR